MGATEGDDAGVTDMTFLFAGAEQFNQDLSGWTVSSVTRMSFAFADARAFNQNIGDWDVSSVTGMQGMFSGAARFNQDIGGWDVSSVTTMAEMFAGAARFSQNLSAWDVSNVTSVSDFLRGAELTPAHYDALLLGWSQQTLASGLSLHGGTSQYTVAAAAARQSLIDDDGWTITDGGQIAPTDVTVSGGTAYTPPTARAASDASPVGRFTLQSGTVGALLSEATIHLSGTNQGVTAVGLWHSTDDTFDATDTPLSTRTGLDATTSTPSSLHLDNVGFVVPDSTGFLFVTIALNLDIDGEIQATLSAPADLVVPGGTLTNDASTFPLSLSSAPADLTPVFEPSYGAGSALRLDGTGDYVELDDEAPFDLTGNFSVSFWMKTDASGFDDAFEGLVTKGDGTWRVARAGSQSILSFDTNHNGGATVVQATTPVDDGTWHHVAAVYDQNGGEKRIYIDGVLEGTASESRDVDTDDFPVCFGSNAQAGGREFGGQLDQVRIWDRVLTTDEVRTFAHQTVDPSTPPSGLLSSHPFTVGGTAYDVQLLDATGPQDGSLVGDAALEPVSGALIGAESVAIASGGSGSETVGPTGGSVTAENVSATGGPATLSLYQYGDTDGPIIDGTTDGEDFSSAGVDQRLHLVWGLSVSEDDAQFDTLSADVTLDFSQASPVNDPSAVRLLERERAGTPWQDVTADWTLDSGARTFTGTPNLSASVPSRTYAVAGSPSALPVELAGFSAKVQNADVRLSWTTASETDNAGFEVQRRADSTAAWKTLGFVASKATGGTTTEAKQYRFNAKKLDVGTHRFRLRQVDVGGTARLSETITAQVRMTDRYRLTSYPNPATRRATIELAVREKQEVRLVLYDVLGRRVATLHDGAVPAQETKELTLNVNRHRLSSGAYFLRITGEDFTGTRRMMIVR